MHRFAEIRQYLAGAVLAGFLFIRIASFAPDQLAVFERQAASANPVLSIADVDMIELRHVSILCPYSGLGCVGGALAVEY